MKRSKLLLCLAVLGITLPSSFLVYMFTVGNLGSNLVVVSASSFERCTITKVSVSESASDTLLITVKWERATYDNRSVSITFTDSIAKDHTDEIVATLGSPTPNELPAHTEMTLKANSSRLTSGIYTLQLVTSKGKCFVSPSFTIP